MLRTAYVLSAAIGGLLSAGLVLLLDGRGGSTTRTVVEQAPVAAAAAAAAERTGLTAHEIYQRSAPGVVFVRAQIVRDVASPFGLPERQEGAATGSGFVVDDQGRILTNYHVIAGAVRVTVELADERVMPARIVGVDPSKDIALLRAERQRARLHPLPLGDSDDIKVGDPVLALGNPFGLERTLTAGIVSALQRHIRAPNGFLIQDVIQTDAAINPGNSGGPLLDSSGRVIGINSQIATDSSGAGTSIGFAIPIETARRDIPELERKGRVDRGWLGVGSSESDSASATGGGPAGARIVRVVAGSPADRAGLRPGDLIVRFGSRPVRSADDMQAMVGDARPGERLTVVVVRRGKRLTLYVTLGRQPPSAFSG